MWLIVVLLLLLVTPAWGQGLITNWQAGGIYPQGAMVRFQGSIFLCSAVAGCTGNLGGSQSPANSSPAGIWNALSGANQWRSDLTYAPGDMVMQSGTLFSAIITNINVDPAGGLQPETWRGRGTLPGPRFNVRNFGAKGTGCPTNDSAAIQAAIDAAQTAAGSTAGYGIGVYFPSGVYCLGTKLVVSAFHDYVLYGDGTSSVITSTSGMGMSSGTPLLHIIGSGSGFVHDLGFIGTHGLRGIQVDDPSSLGRSRYYNLSFQTFGFGIVFSTISAWNSFSNIFMQSVTNGIKFENCTHTGNVFTNLNMIGTQGEAITPSVGIEFAGVSGVSTCTGPEGSIGDITLTGIQLGGFTTGFKFSPAADYRERVQITAAQVNAGSGTAIDMQQYDVVTIYGFSTGGAYTNNLTGTTCTACQPGL